MSRCECPQPDNTESSPDLGRTSSRCAHSPWDRSFQPEKHKSLTCAAPELNTSIQYLLNRVYVFPGWMVSFLYHDMIERSVPTAPFGKSEAQFSESCRSAQDYPGLRHILKQTNSTNN